MQDDVIEGPLNKFTVQHYTNSFTTTYIQLDNFKTLSHAQLIIYSYTIYITTNSCSANCAITALLVVLVMWGGDYLLLYNPTINKGKI